MGKKLLLLGLLGMSCPVFAATSTIIDTSTSATKTTIKVVVITNQTDNDPEASPAAATNPATPSSARNRSATNRNPSTRWHSMMPGMFR
jgi:hypothetical protein